MCFLDQKTHLPLSQISWNRLNICSAQFLSRAQRHDILQYLVSTWVIWLWNLTFFAWLPYEPVAGFPLPSSALLCSKAVNKSAKTYTEDLKSRAHFWSNLDVPHVLRKILLWYFSSPYIQSVCKKYQTIAEYHPLTRISLTVASGSIQLPCICIYPVHSKPFQTIQTFCWPLALHSTLIAHSFLGLRKSTEISSFRKFWCYFLCTHHLWLRESARVSGDAKAFPRFTFSEKCRTSDEIKGRAVPLLDRGSRGQYD